MLASSEQRPVDDQELEHLFGGSDLTTAVRVLYNASAPERFYQHVAHFKQHKDKEIENVCSEFFQARDPAPPPPHTPRDTEARPTHGSALCAAV